MTVATVDRFTSTGAKFFAHQEAMKDLRNGKGHPIVTHLMPTDRCNHTCAFCSVLTREGQTLPFLDMIHYLTTLKRFGLKAVIISGGGNPILYNYRATVADTPPGAMPVRWDFNDLAETIYSMGLEIGLITNGMPLEVVDGRKTWKGIKPSTLDKCTWVRISMSGFDHPEDCVYVPDFDKSRTTLGFSYVLHDIYTEPGDENHGKVSTLADLKTPGAEQTKFAAVDRLATLTEQIHGIVAEHHPAYVRLLPNCLEPPKIAERCELLRKMAETVNRAVGYDPMFVQYKPPSAPKKCYLGYIHPVLNSDGFVYPCDSCVLNETADHKFANPWRICHWSEIGKLFEAPVRSLIVDPSTQCPGCVFPKSNALLQEVVEGTIDLSPPSEIPSHVNFV